MRLAEALREATDGLAGYDVVERAIARGRRRRRAVVAASALCVVAVLGVATPVVAPRLTRDTTPVAEPDGPSIPERIGPPGLFTPDAAENPPGPASLIFSGGGDLVVVGAADDAYRVLDTDADAGWDAMLSPTGDRVAYAHDREIRVVDLVRGGWRGYGPAAATVDYFAPQAWLPDGTGLVVLRSTNADDPTTQGISRELSIMDLETGSFEPFAEATWPIATPGFAVAVSPDGGRIAYQYSSFITVFDRQTREKTRFDLETAYYALAGRSAWAPDGSLALIHWDSQASYGTWEVLLVDPTTGAHKDIAATTHDRKLIRVIGWSGDRPVIVGYGNGECYPMFAYGEVLDPYSRCKVGVYELFGDAAQMLVAPADDVFHIDVAESLLAEPVRRSGNPPWTVPNALRGYPAVLLGILGIAVAWGLLARWLSRRAAGRGRSSGPAAS